MAEKNANEMPSGQNDEKILVLEEMPSKGKTVGRTTVLTDSVRDLIKSEKKNGETYNMELSEDGALPTQSKKGKVKLLDVRQNDNPLTAFMRNLTAHLDAMDTKGDLKSIYVVSANIYRLNSLSNCRIDSSPKLIQLSRTMSFSVQKLREEEKFINDGMMIDSTKIDWKKLENDFEVKADWLTRKGQVDTPLHIQQSDAVKAARPLIDKYNDQWLRTEYNTAVLRARSAVQYRDALRTKALYPSLEYLESDSVEKREEHLALVGTIRPIEDPWWDTHTPPLAWNCKCRIRPTDKPVTPIPEETAKDKLAPGLSGNPGRSGSVFDLKSHPYTRGQGDPHCPECRRQGLVKSSDLRDLPGDRLCPMHKEAEMAAKDAEALRTLIAERRKEYKRLLKDPNYVDVRFDEKTGGLMASHRDHNFCKDGGEGENTIQQVGYANGHAVILTRETHSIPNQKNIDGTWDGLRMEVATARTGTGNNIRDSLKHCAKKPGVDVAVLNITSEHFEMEAGLSKYNGLRGTSQWRQFREIVIIHKKKIVAHYR